MIDNDIIQYEIKGCRVQLLFDEWIEKTAKQQVDAEMKLINDLENIRWRYGDEKRSLANLVNDKDHNKTIRYEAEFDDLLYMRYVPKVVDVLPEQMPVSKPIRFTPPPYFVFDVAIPRDRDLDENSIDHIVANNTDRRAKSDFKRFVRKRRK